MAEAYYEPTPATDGATMNPVPGAVFQVYEIADTTFSTPLSLRVGSGNPTTTVTASDTLATLPGVYVTSPNYEHIWKSGTFEWRRDSITGAKKAIEDAKLAASNSASASDASAVSAANSAQAAQDAAALVDAPADQIMADTAANPATAFAGQLSATTAEKINSRTGMELRITDLNKYVLGPTAPTAWVTPDASGVVVHPSVRFFPDGFNGYHYWAAATPYKDSNNQVENPCIFVSQDGTNWAPPPGVANPLTPAPAGGYNSDTHLIQGPNGNLLLFYRDYGSSGTAAEKIRLMESADGITWSAPTEVMAYSDSVRRIVSPSVWWDASASRWVMLGVEIIADPRVVQRFTATSPYGPWTFDQNVTFDLAWGATKSPWHIDAMLIGTQVLMVVQDAVGDGDGGDVYLALSGDGGKSFKRATNPIASLNRYRSCVLPRITETGLALDLWLGTVGGVWTINRGTAVAPAGLTATQQATHDLMAAKTATDPFTLGDDFNRADNATGLGTAPSGQAWTASTGTMAIVGKRATAATNANSRAFIDAGVANYELNLDIIPTSAAGSQGWLVIRAIDGSNYIRIGRDGYGFQIQRITSGGVTLLHDFGNLSNTSNKVTVTANGSTITVNTTGQTRTFTETQGQAATLIGLQISNTAVFADNLTVKAI